ncbi:MAG: 5'-deoxynucleotidase [Oscillospiraceae bacterium]|nr:5'-deoxynucleotidase [Oscillospiraceae bacterium]
MSDFFAFAARTKYINRWALMRNTRYETLSEHSAEVAEISYALAVIGNERLGKNYNAERASLLGLYHDLPEIITGDLPTPVKYYSEETKSAYKAVEKNASKQLLSMLPDDLRGNYEPLFKKKADDKELWRLVKSADKICAYLKCIEERLAGNREFCEAEKTITKTLQRLDCEEAKIFIEEFVPSFEKTIDQMKK